MRKLITGTPRATATVEEKKKTIEAIEVNNVDPIGATNATS